MARTQQELITNLIPFEESLLVTRLREFLGDEATLNVLDEVKESSDQELHHALQDALDEINYEFNPTSINYESMLTVPSWNLLKLGATLQILTSKGILSARNTLTYQDSGGVTVQNEDKYGRYINYYNILVNKYVRGVTNMKLGKNIEDAYGGVESEYGPGWDIYD